ncbi:hypothetical protein GQ600_19637 [Phytophthora cactorum]|nr:hypothetical protein GQ600_19637 [Phytophthora cactorum]
MLTYHNCTGLPITTQQVRNLIYARLGHGNAEQRLKAVLTEFASTEDNKGVLLQGDWNQTVGIGLQTKAQQKIFSRWGDMLALDWTHNCTNFGFYVGTSRSCLTLIEDAQLYDVAHLRLKVRNFTQTIFFITDAMYAQFVQKLLSLRCLQAVVSLS